jgi:hypothetical protein
MPYTDEERFRISLSMKHKLKLVMTTSEYGLQSNLTTNQLLIFISFSRKKNIFGGEFYSKSG